MHDFCFTPLYSAVLVLGGLAGLATKGSVASLVAGVTAAAVTGVCAYVSLQLYISQKKKCVPAVVISLVVALAVAGKMGMAVAKEPLGNLMKGFVCVISAGMACYYIWNLACFRPTAHKPTEPMDMQKLRQDAKQYAQSKKT